MKRVVVTGVGCISALGTGYPRFADQLLAGTEGIGPITRFDTEGCLVRVAAEVKDYDPSRIFSEKQLAQIDIFAQFALLATREAVADAGLSFAGSLAARTAVIHGSGIGGQVTQDASYHRLYAEHSPRLHPFTVPKLMPSAGVSHICMEFGLTGPAFATTSACASSGHAIGMGLLLLRAGLVEVAITGGAEACLAPGALKAWEGLRVMAKDTCRPFSRERGGMVLGEGAGCLILETLDHAQKRGATIHAELVGFGMSSDAFSLIQPRAEGAAQAMTAALNDAALNPEAVDYLNAHGTGTPQNDPTETRAIHLAFGDHARRLAISSTKSMHGHTLGAASALEAIATVAAIKMQTAPPTIGYLGPDPQCDLDYVPNQARPLPIQVAMSNSFAFGGLNVSLVWQRF